MSERPPYLDEAEAVCKRRGSSKYPDAEQRLIVAVVKAYRDASYDLPVVEHVKQIGHCINATTDFLQVKDISVQNLLYSTAGVKTIRDAMAKMPDGLRKYVFVKKMGTMEKWSVAVDVAPRRAASYICCDGIYIIRLEDMPYG